MSIQRRLAWVAVAALAVAFAGLYASRSVPRSAPRISVLYVRGLSGCLDEADRASAGGPAGASAASLHGALQARATASPPPGETIVIDLGNSLTGLGNVNAVSAGAPMAAAIRLASCQAVMPSTRDLWTGKDALEDMAQEGGFSFLLTNAMLDRNLPPQWGRPRILSVDGLKVAIFGAYAPPYEPVGGFDETRPFTFSQDLGRLKQSMASVGADVNVVLAHVDDPLYLARQLPEAHVVIPAGPTVVPAAPPLRDGDVEQAPPVDAEAARSRLALALPSPATMGSVIVTRDAENRITTSFELIALEPAPPDARFEEAMAPYRAAASQASGGRNVPTAALVRAFVSVPGGSASAPELAADLCREQLSCDVAVLSANDIRGRLSGPLSDAELTAVLGRDARVSIVALDGGSLTSLLGRNPKAVVSGLSIWRGDAATFLRFRGKSLDQVSTLRVALSTRLQPTSDPRASVELASVLREALLTRPLLASPATRSFALDGDELPDVAGLLERAAAEVKAYHRARARELWVQAAALQPDEETSDDLLHAMQSAEPHRPPSYAELGAIQEAAGNRRLALAAYEMGRVAWRTSWAYPLAEARLVLQAGLPSAAESLLDEARALGAPEADVALLRGQLLLNAGRAKDASTLLATVLERAKKEDAWRAPARVLEGMALLRQGDVEGALVSWSRLQDEPGAAAQRGAP